MDDGIFWFFYVIIEAIRNFLVHTPFKFMLFALLVITGSLFFVFWERISLNEIWRYHFLSYEIWRFIVQKVLGLHIHFWIYNIVEYSFNARIRCSLNIIKIKKCRVRVKNNLLKSIGYSTVSFVRCSGELFLADCFFHFTITQLTPLLQLSIYSQYQFFLY